MHRRIPALSVLAAITAAVAMPTPANAAPARYVVTLQSALGAPCEAAIRAVTTDLGVAPTAVYSSSVCGFAAELTRPKSRDAAADPRVLSVVVDAEFTAA